MKHRPRCSLSADDGFTLIEALISITLMGLILAAIATLTAQWLPNWNRGFARAQRSELVALGVERTVADLSAAEFISPNRSTKNPLFEGTELGATFVRSAIGPNARPGLEVVRIAETADERGLLLVRTRAPFAPTAVDSYAAGQFRFADPVVLVRAPYRVSFSYAGPDQVWRDTWLGANALPVAVRIRIRDAATDRTLALSTATLIHAEVPADCIKAKILPGCGETVRPERQDGRQSPLLDAATGGRR